MKPLSLALIIAYWLVPLAPRAQTLPDSLNAGGSFYKMGMRVYHLSDDSTEEAVQLFTKAIENGQDVAGSYMMRGACKGILKQYMLAIDDLNASKLLDSSYSKLYYYYGDVYLREGMNLMALHYFDIAISMDSTNPEYYNSRAIVECFHLEYDKVVRDENKAISLDTTNEDYFVNRGYATMRLNKFDKAIEDFTHSMRIQETQRAFANRGYSYAQLGKYEQAITDYSRSLRFVMDGQVLCLRGIAYEALGKKQEACEDFKKSADMNYKPALNELEKNCK